MPEQKYSLLPDELSRGFRYLLFQMLFLPSILMMLLRFTPFTDSASLNLCYMGVNFLALGWIFRRYLLATLRSFPRLWKKILFWGLVGCLCYQLLTHLISLLVLFLMPDFFNVNDAFITATAQQSYWIVVVCTVVLAPVTEELCYRALVFGAFAHRSEVLAWVVSVLLFASIHVSGYIGMFPLPLLGLCFLEYLPASLVLAFAYQKSGSILCPMAIHMAINIVGVLSMR